ncbi:hypothetical protein HD806DRAFT_549290 [Xylariaceae sp. AK1471]|nr:hypothetical protein HD806DRAFT_549290 [Xylariaceae sp. AK1471]
MEEPSIWEVNLNGSGQPAAWELPLLPCQLHRDSGVYKRDQYGARFTGHPIQATVQALFVLNHNFDPSITDIMGCASSIGDIFRFARSINSTFRFDVEVVGNTLFLVRNCKNDIIPAASGYGRSFLNVSTSTGTEGGKSKSHQCIVSYDFGDLKCLVRFKCDGHFTNYDGHDTVLTKQRFHLPDQPQPSSIPLQKAGMIASQDDYVPRLWLQQIPYFINAYHKQGSFEDIQIHNICKDLLDWEAQHQDNADALDISHTYEAELALVRQPSSVESGWQRWKDLEFASNGALDSLMQVIRLESAKKSRKRGSNLDELQLLKTNIIGPKSCHAMSSSKDWQSLQKIVDLKSGKPSIQVLVGRLQANYNALVQSEKNIKAALEATKGTVLIIGEKYMLAGRMLDTGGTSDPDKVAVIDTIIAEV